MNSMEKGEKMDTCDTDSMTTVNVKDYGSTLDYQEAPPAYRQAKMSTTVQVTKIVAVAVVVIAAMLSISLVFSAWIASTSCQSQQPSSPVLEALLQPEHLKSILAFGGNVPANDLDLAESKASGAKDNKDSSEEDSAEDEDAAVTMLRLPLELSLQEHMFERNHRSHMNCVIEKKKAEEIVDEQSKPLPVLLGINMTTDPRYLHFTGEKMAISCDSGNDHRQVPPMGVPPMSHPMHPMDMPNRNRQDILMSSSRRQPLPLGDMLSAIAAAGSASVPIHIIGPIPLNQEQGANDMPMPFHRFSPQQFNFPEQHQQMYPQQEEEQQLNENNNLGPLSALGIPPHLIPVLLPQGNHLNLDDSSNGRHSEQIFIHPQSGELRGERALPHPIPIMPRAHVQHVIRPRSVENPEEPATQKRVKRCSCDCACKNHQAEQ